MYYLQSRYYNPELCRFISADGFEYLTTESNLNLNAYVYCWNCPVIFDDIEGTTPKLSINLSDISSFIKNINNIIKDGINSEINSIKDKYTKLFDNWKKSLITRYNSFIDKLEYFINYPDAVINSTLSKLLNTEVNIRFRLIESIREKSGKIISLSNLKYQENNNDSRMARSAPKSDSGDTTRESIIDIICQLLFGGIIIDAIDRAFSAIKINLTNIMNDSIKNNWFGLFEELISSTVALFSAGFVTIKNNLNSLNIFKTGFNKSFKQMINDANSSGDLIEAGKGSSFLKGFSILTSLMSFSDSIDNSGNGVLSKNSGIVLSVVGLVLDIAQIFVPITLNPFLSAILSLSADIVPVAIAMRWEGLIIC